MDENQARWPIGELARRVAAALAVGYDGPGNARVRGVPDVRSIRWYATIGLLDKPGGFRGRTALYGPRHLRQLVAVKRRQAAGAPLSQIQAELAGASPAELERLARVPAELLDGPAEAGTTAVTDAGAVGAGISATPDAGVSESAAPNPAAERRDPAASASAPAEAKGAGGVSAATDAGAGESAAPNLSAERRELAASGAVSTEAAVEAATVAPEHGAEPTAQNPSPEQRDVAAESGESLNSPDFAGSGEPPGAPDSAGSAIATGPGTTAPNGEPLAGPGSGSAEATFWKTPPVNVAVTATPRHADPPATLSYGLKLAEGLTLLVDAAHCPTREDHEAVLAAAQPLLRALRARGLHTTAYTGVSS